MRINIAVAIAFATSLVIAGLTCALFDSVVIGAFYFPITLAYFDAAFRDGSKAYRDCCRK